MSWLNSTKIFVVLLLFGAQAMSQELFYSPSGRYVGRVSKGIGGTREGPFYRSFSLELVDSGGGVRYTIARAVPYDAPYPDVYVSDYGEVILLDPFNGTASFYDTDGDPLYSLEFFKDEAPELERVLQADVAGTNVAFLWSDPHNPSAQLGLYDVEGNPRWTKSLDQPFAYRLEFLPRDEFVGELDRLIIASTYDAPSSTEPAVTTSVVSVLGDVLARFRVLFRHADYSLKAHLLVLADQSTAVAVRTGDLLEQWNWRLSALDSGRVITAVVVGDEGHVVIETAAVTMGSLGWVFLDPAVLLFQRDGTLVWRRDLPGVQFTSSKLKIVDSVLKVQLGAGREITIRLFD